jgi:hypothetical protein
LRFSLRVWDFNPTEEELERVLTRNFVYKEIDKLLEIDSDEDRPPRKPIFLQKRIISSFVKG